MGKAEVKASDVLDVAVPPPGRAEPGLIPFHVERREPRLEPEKRAYFVVHTGIVRSVGDVKAFRCKLQVSFLA